MLKVVSVGLFAAAVKAGILPLGYQMKDSRIDLETYGSEESKSMGAALDVELFLETNPYEGGPEFMFDLVALDADHANICS